MAENKIRKLNNLLLYAVVVEFYLFGSLWNMMLVSGIPYLLLYWGFFLLGLMKILLQKNSWKEWLLVFALFAVAALSWKGSQDKTPLLLMLGVCCAKDIDLDMLIKVDLCNRIFSSLFLILLPVMGIYENRVFSGRMCFGWEVPNGMGLTFTVVCMEWLYLRHHKFKWYDYAGILSLAAFLHVTARSRTSEMLILLMLAAELVGEWLRRKGKGDREYKVWACTCGASLALALLMPCAAMFLYTFFNERLMALYGGFVGRFQIPGQFYDAHGLTLFGSPYDPKVYDYLDMLFAYLPLHLGIVAAVAVLLLMIGTIWYGYRKKNERLLLFFMFVLLRSTMESEHFTLVYAFFPILLGLAVWDHRQPGQIGELC